MLGAFAAFAAWEVSSVRSPQHVICTPRFSCKRGETSNVRIRRRFCGDPPASAGEVAFSAPTPGGAWVSTLPEIMVGWYYKPAWSSDFMAFFGEPKGAMPSTEA